MRVEPLIFEPYLRPQIWGGRALERMGKVLPSADRYGESWEVSAHPHHASIVRDGALAGQSLADLVREYPSEILGIGPGARPREFPLLVKLLDCHDLLSVQVHPDDATAQRLLGEERGKTEAWVVLEAAPTARIFAGLKEGVDQARFEAHVRAHTTDQCLHEFRPRPGDCIHIPAGTVHTMGGGVILAEVQQSSDATFRLFDWNRVGPDGRPRALHIEESLASIDYSRGPVQPTSPVPLEGLDGASLGQRLVECDYFCIDRIEARGELANPYSGRMSLWMPLRGSMTLSAARFRRGLNPFETVLIPAGCAPTHWSAGDSSQTSSLLCITLPSHPLP